MCTLPLCVYPSLRCTDFVIVQLLPTSAIDIQDNPTIVHVGHYGRPTITLLFIYYLSILVEVLLRLLTHRGDLVLLYLVSEDYS
jgi:hypothetical protein